MELRINSNNEYKFFPDLFGNLELPEDQQFCIVLKKINSSVSLINNISYDDSGNMLHNKIGMMKDHVKKIINPIVLVMDSGEKREIKIDDFFSGEFVELEELTNLLIIEINKLRSGSIDKKK